ncbi:RidA family protein [Burkholderia multivorans]|uniref:Enamine deaminase RidA n=1 Tax=Burkholderia multivorans TaxID=87883 RepID=A0AB37ARZ5_9BURK|nr:RidA family protein [Burkholderia multivorans]MBR8017805.1 RidA family protein [Burkholderia multivorans]MBU9126346.1 RidA family protein [Burkholderia multivorans]MBU9283868.1 RidA family protein [Burkholderia multivorans]MBU9298405.1 RidA family protein [Burkholderia multivorans]MBU9303622.1 RidA family protein [Burkholderia multivorans]
MKIEQVHTNPDPYAPFLLSQAIRVGDFVFVSGQPAIGEDGEIDGPGDFDRQAERAFGNLARVLQAAGSGMDRVVKTTVFLSSMSYLDKMVDIRRKWFTAPYPAESLVEVAALFSPDALIEVEAIAVVSEAKAGD